MEQALTYDNHLDTSVEEASLSAVLIQLREERNWSQRELANMINMNLSAIRNYESGAQRPSPSTLVKLSLYLGQDLGARFPILFTGAPVPDKLIRKPANLHHRLLRLVQLLDLGVQRSFAERVGISQASISHLIAGRIQLSEDFKERIMTSIPTLRAEWLLVGKGEIFQEKVRA
jgi:transcriptional regulator with XRE-family HTH domain